MPGRAGFDKPFTNGGSAIDQEFLENGESKEVDGRRPNL
jgi:hypothetical protein